MRLRKQLERFGLDAFLLFLLLSIGVAYIQPSWGAKSGPIPLAEIANWGVMFIFFFYGLKLNFKEIKKGISNFKLHAVVHTTTFLLFPLIAALLYPLFHTSGWDSLWIGLFFLCALPSTVSSSVVMVGIAGGNLPGAIFNASISSLLGVLFTPLWMGLVVSSTEGAIDLIDVLIKLCIQVVVPVGLGILLNRVGEAWAKKNAKYTKLFDQFVIILIVYTSFCESFKDNVFSGVSLSVIGALIVGAVVLFFTVYYIVKVACNQLGFQRPDTITALFCGSKKSLVQGAVMSKVLFYGMPQLGIILLPIMIYHSVQLLIVGILAQRFAQENTSMARSV